MENNFVFWNYTFKAGIDHGKDLVSQLSVVLITKHYYLHGLYSQLTLSTQGRGGCKPIQRRPFDVTSDGKPLHRRKNIYNFLNKEIFTKNDFPSKI